MAKFHINPETGSVGVCKARVNPCPYLTEGEHYRSKEEALEHYENIMAGQEHEPLSWKLGKANSPVKGPDNFVDFTKQNFQAYANLGLSEEEAKDVNYYSITGFEYINKHLRNLPLVDPNARFNHLLPKDHVEQMLELSKKTIKSLDAIFERTEKNPRVTYRYCEPPAGMTSQEYLSSLMEKGVFQDPAYLSTSASVDLPLAALLEQEKKDGQYVSRDRYLLEIVSEDNITIQRKETPYSGNIQSLENEVLIARDIEFEVVGVDFKRKMGFGDARPMMKEYFRMYEAGNYRLQDKMDKQEYFRVPVVQLVQRRK